MKRLSVLLIVMFSISACNTYKAAQGDTTSNRVVGGMKQDAQATGETIERGVQGVGDALGKALK
jgi:predicted small secreted protein